MSRADHRPRFALLAGVLYVLVVAACATRGPRNMQLHGWWQGLGPVLPHDSFPADCSLCHEGTNWGLREDFEFDHKLETGVALEGAHDHAQCLRCHNDRGPVASFQARGCAGCHEDVHLGRIAMDCTRCHNESNWFPQGQVALHRHTRMPLSGVHAVTSCRRCHIGAEQGLFVPTDTDCLTCHRDDLARAINPPHQGLGWVDRCDRCHKPTSWNDAQTNQ